MWSQGLLGSGADREPLYSSAKRAESWGLEDPDSRSDAVALVPVTSPLQAWTCLSVGWGHGGAGYCEDGVR